MQTDSRQVLGKHKVNVLAKVVLRVQFGTFGRKGTQEFFLATRQSQNHGV